MTIGVTPLLFAPRRGASRYLSRGFSCCFSRSLSHSYAGSGVALRAALTEIAPWRW